MVTVLFPPQFAKILNGQLSQVGEGSNLNEVLASICKERSDLRKHLFLDSGEISPFIAFTMPRDENIYSSLLTDSVVLKPGDSVEVILSMAGG